MGWLWRSSSGGWKGGGDWVRNYRISRKATAEFRVQDRDPSGPAMSVRPSLVRIRARMPQFVPTQTTVGVAIGSHWWHMLGMSVREASPADIVLSVEHLSAQNGPQARREARTQFRRNPQSSDSDPNRCHWHRFARPQADRRQIPSQFLGQRGAGFWDSPRHRLPQSVARQVLSDVQHAAARSHCPSGIGFAPYVVGVGAVGPLCFGTLLEELRESATTSRGVRHLP